MRKDPHLKEHLEFTARQFGARIRSISDRTISLHSADGVPYEVKETPKGWVFPAKFYDATKEKFLFAKQHYFTKDGMRAAEYGGRDEKDLLAHPAVPVHSSATAALRDGLEWLQNRNNDFKISQLSVSWDDQGDGPFGILKYRVDGGPLQIERMDSDDMLSNFDNDDLREQLEERIEHWLNTDPDAKETCEALAEDAEKRHEETTRPSL